MFSVRIYAVMCYWKYDFVILSWALTGGFLQDLTVWNPLCITRLPLEKKWDFNQAVCWTATERVRGRTGSRRGVVEKEDSWQSAGYVWVNVYPEDEQLMALQPSVQAEQSAAASALREQLVHNGECCTRSIYKHLIYEAGGLCMWV